MEVLSSTGDILEMPSQLAIAIEKTLTKSGNYETLSSP